MRLRNVPEAKEIVAASPYVLHLQGEKDGSVTVEPHLLSESEPGCCSDRFYFHKCSDGRLSAEKCFCDGGATLPLHIEIGMGKGQFIIESARRNPEAQFIGVERYESVLYKACEKMRELEAAGEAPENLRFISADARELPEYLGEACADRLYLNFSDPWPKERHAKRRLTSPQFLKLYGKLLKDGATLQMKTDRAPLFDYSLETLREEPHFEITAVTRDLHRDEALMRENIMTEYERKFSALGSKICQLTAVYHAKGSATHIKEA